MRTPASTEAGSAALLVLGVVLATAFLLALLAAIGGAYVAHAELQQAADLAAVTLEQAPGDSPRTRAIALARANGASAVRLHEEAGGTRLRIEVRGRSRPAFGAPRGRMLRALAWADLPTAQAFDGRPNPPGTYSGPLEVVDGVPVCPAVAAAFRRMDAAAAHDGITLTPTSGFRGYAEQALLYARLGPGIAAPPGASRHHDATELDIAVGPAGSPAHAWLRRHGPGFGFVQRYSWEPWHWGFLAGC